MIKEAGKNMTHQILRIILIAIVFGIYVEDIYAIPQKTSPVVYIDPFFGGKDSGPILDQKYAGKTITLDIAKKLSALLAEKGIKTTFSREQDSFLSLAERIKRSRMEGADIYIAITLGQSDKDCITISYAKQLSETYEKRKDDVSHILIDWMGDKIVKESKLLADSIKEKLKAKSVVKCMIVESKRTYLLENSFIPTIIIDFQVIKSGPRPTYIRNAITVNKILRAVSEGIQRNIEKKEKP
jgi:N-acetylmuramoyl-L-alanine amidase